MVRKAIQNASGKDDPRVKPSTDWRMLIAKASVVAVGVIVIFSILYIGGIISLPDHSSSLPSSPPVQFTPPTYDSWGNFLKVSQNNYAQNNNNEDIYFLSWMGCPIGAADSWVLYGSLGSHLNGIESTTYAHHSDPNEESLSNIPGIIFESGFHFVSSNVTVTFDPVYVYNETMYGQEGSNYGNPNGTGVPISPSDMVSYGFSIAKASLPPPIYEIIKEYEAVYPVNNIGSGNLPIVNSSNSPHVTTIMVITDRYGTFIFNGPFYGPTEIKQYSVQYLYSSYGSVPEILAGISQLNSYIL